MKKMYWMLIGLFGLFALLLCINSASASICVNNNTNTIYLTGGDDVTVSDIYNDTAVNDTILHEYSQFHTYLLNYSIQINQTAVLKIEGDTCDWLRLASQPDSGAIKWGAGNWWTPLANITVYGRLFINNSLVSSWQWDPGGTHRNDSYVYSSLTYRIDNIYHAMPNYRNEWLARPYIAVNSSKGYIGITSSRIESLGYQNNITIKNGVSIRDDDGYPNGTIAYSHFSNCVVGLVLTDNHNVDVDECNFTDNLLGGIRVCGSNCWVNITNTNFSNNWYRKSGWGLLIEPMESSLYAYFQSVVVYNHTNPYGQFVGNYNSLMNGAAGAVRCSNYTGGFNRTEKFLYGLHSSGDTMWNLTVIDVRVRTSNNDYCVVNLTNFTYDNGRNVTSLTFEATAESDTDFVEFTFGDMTPSYEYTVKVDGTAYQTAQSDTNGDLTFNYTGTWSTHTFSFVGIGAVPTFSGGGGGGASLVGYHTYYKCINGRLVEREARSCPDGWSETKPTCGETTPPAQITAEDDFEIPGFEMIFVILSLGVIFLIRKRKFER